MGEREARTAVRQRRRTTDTQHAELPESAAQLVLIFDGTCDLCTASVTALYALDWRRRMLFAPFQRSGLPEAAGLTYAQCERSVWAITRDGRRLSGAAAVSAALDQLTVLPLFTWIARLPGVARLEEAAYAWVARNRSHLPGVRPYCADHPDDCANR
jgi:predicted DCC family thiol-disulfide oxidoreductase YuxK